MVFYIESVNPYLNLRILQNQAESMDSSWKKMFPPWILTVKRKQTRNALSWEQPAHFQQFNVKRNSAYVYLCSHDLDLEQVTLAKYKEIQT